MSDCDKGNWKTTEYVKSSENKWWIYVKWGQGGLPGGSDAWTGI